MLALNLWFCEKKTEKKELNSELSLRVELKRSVAAAKSAPVLFSSKCQTVLFADFPFSSAAFDGMKCVGISQNDVSPKTKADLFLFLYYYYYYSLSCSLSLACDKWNCRFHVLSCATVSFISPCVCACVVSFFLCHQSIHRRILNTKSVGVCWRFSHSIGEQERFPRIESKTYR